MKVYKMISNKLFFNSIIRFTLLAYLETLIAALLNMKDLSFGEDVGDTISSILAIITVSLASIYPFVMGYMLIKN